MFIDKNSNIPLLICRLFVTPVEDVRVFPEGSSRFFRSIIFFSGKGWKEIYFTPGSAVFKEKEKEEDAGVLIEQSAKFIFPGDDSDNLSLFDQLQGRQLLVLVDLNMGLSKVFGDLENGTRLKRVSEISSKTATCECELTCVSQDWAWRLETGPPTL